MSFSASREAKLLDRSRNFKARANKDKTAFNIILSSVKQTAYWRKPSPMSISPTGLAKEEMVQYRACRRLYLNFQSNCQQDLRIAASSQNKVRVRWKMGCATMHRTTVNLARVRFYSRVVISAAALPAIWPEMKQSVIFAPPS